MKLTWISPVVTIASLKDYFPLGFFLFHPGAMLDFRLIVSLKKIAYGDFLKRTQNRIRFWLTLVEKNKLTLFNNFKNSL